MFKLILKNMLTKTESEINVIKTFVSFISVLLSYSVLVWVVVALNYTWMVFPWAIIGILHSTYSSFHEEKLMLKNKKVILSFDYILANILYWIPVLYVCLNVNLNSSINMLFCFAWVLSLISTLFSARITANMFDSLKKSIYIQENYFDEEISDEMVEKATKNLTKLITQSTFFIILPKFISFVLFWWALIKIYHDFNLSVYFVLYMIFVLVLSFVLVEFLKDIRKELINKMIKL